MWCKGFLAAVISLWLIGCDNGSSSNSQDVGKDESGSIAQINADETATAMVYASDGVEIYYEVSGAQRAAADPTLIFVHGWSCNTEFWREQLPVFAKTHRVVALDLGGHGKSGTDRGVWSIADYGQDVAAVADKLKLNNIVLIGHSMGGPVALAAAAKLPGKVRAVIGVDTLHDASLTYTPQQVGQMMAAFQGDFAGSMKGTFEALAGPTVPLALQEWIVAEGRKANPDVAVALLGDFARISLPELLRSAGVPVRVINAAGGPMTAQTQVETNRQYADFDAIIMDGVGHFLQLEQPRAFNQQLAQLLENIKEQG